VLIVITEAVIIMLLIYIVISQLLVPAYRGTKMFPFFRKERKLKEQIVEANQDLYEDELEVQVAARHAAAERRRKAYPPDEEETRL
jgi:hypothetical protein